MKTILSPRIMMRTALVMILFGMFAFGAFAVAQSDASTQPSKRQCSNRTLSGEYGCSVQGFLLNVPGLPPEATFVGVTTSTFDGKGNLTGTEHTVINGLPSNPGFIANSGTYFVDPDCTGSAIVNTPNSPVPLHIYFVIVDDGNEFRQVLNSNALVSVCKRVR